MTASLGRLLYADPGRMRGALGRMRTAASAAFASRAPSLAAVVPGLDAIIHIATLVGGNLLTIALLGAFVDMIAPHYAELITTTPGFDFHVAPDGREMGNSSFVQYAMLREASLVFFIFVFLLFGALMILKKAEIVTGDDMKNMFKSAVFGIIFIMVFPYVWDPISDASTNSALWMLNPLYGFPDGPDDPLCAYDIGSLGNGYLAQIADINREIYDRSHPGGIPLQEFLGAPTEDGMCDYNLRPEYLFAKARFGASVELDTGAFGDDLDLTAMFTQLSAYIQTYLEGIVTAIFAGIAKMSMLLFVATMAVFVSTVRIVLVDIIAISLPILLALRCIPLFHIDRLSNMLLQAFVPLLMVPFFTALIISAGAVALLNMEDDATTFAASCEGADGQITVTDRDSLPPDIAATCQILPKDVYEERFLFWVAAVATLSLGVMAPVMFVPMLGSVSSMGQRMVMTGTMAGVMATTQAVSGAAAGMGTAARGVFGGTAAAGGGGLAGMHNLLGTRAGLGSLAYGAAKGLGRGAGGGFAANTMGLGEGSSGMMHGARAATPGADAPPAVQQQQSPPRAAAGTVRAGPIGTPAHVGDELPPPPPRTGNAIYDRAAASVRPPGAVFVPAPGHAPAGDAGQPESRWARMKRWFTGGHAPAGYSGGGGATFQGSRPLRGGAIDTPGSAEATDMASAVGMIATEKDLAGITMKSRLPINHEILPAMGMINMPLVSPQTAGIEQFNERVAMAEGLRNGIASGTSPLDGLASGGVSTTAPKTTVTIQHQQNP